MNKTTKIIPAIIGLPVIGVGFLFRRMHWPGSKMMITAGGILILVSMVVVLINLFREKKKSTEL